MNFFSKGSILILVFVILTFTSFCMANIAMTSKDCGDCKHCLVTLAVSLSLKSCLPVLSHVLKNLALDIQTDRNDCTWCHDREEEVFSLGGLFVFLWHLC